MRRAMVLLLFLMIGVVPVLAGDLRWGAVTLESPLSETPALATEDLIGNPVKDGELEEVINVLLDDLSRQGYAFARVRILSLDAKDGALYVDLRLEPGTRAYLDRIVLSGARVTRPSLAWRLAGLHSGQAFTGLEAALLERRLKASGLFLTVGTPQLRPGPEPGALLMEIPVEEPAYTHFAGILGVAGERSEVTGLVDLTLNNIAGTARQARAGWMNQGNGLSRFHLSYHEPWLPLIPLGLEGELGHEVREDAYSYTRWNLTGSLKAGNHWELSGGWGGARSVEVDTTRDNAHESFLLAGVTLDHRNQAVNPDRGFRVSLRTRRGTKTVGEAVHHRTRWELGTESYLPLSRQWLLAWETQTQYLDTPERPVAVYDLIPVGGARSLRGYREEQFLTPLAVLWRSEWRRVLDGRGSAVYGFVDGGWIAPNGSVRRDRLDTFLLGYGAGVRQGIPVGMISVEYGIPRGRSLSSGRIHLRLSAAF